MASIIRKPFNYTFKKATFAIILINVAIYLLEKIFPEIMFYLSLNVRNVLGYGMYWEPFTYMFVHGNFQHILFNMIALFFFGLSVERALGTKEFLLMYFVCGILGGLFSLCFYFLTGLFGVYLMGASGAAAVLYAREAKKIKEEGGDAKAFIAEKEEEYSKLFANPYNAAKYGYIDDVIEPRNTRFRVIRALEQLANKSLTNPAKKHGNIPL